MHIKRKGNILIISSIFLMVSIIFFLSIYKILGLNINEEDKILNRGALDLEKKREYVVKILQKHANTLDEIELGKKYKYPQNLVDSTLAIENVDMEFKEKEALLSYIITGNKEKIELNVDYIKENLCVCNRPICEYQNEKIIFIPQRRIIND